MSITTTDLNSDARQNQNLLVRGGQPMSSKISYDIQKRVVAIKDEMKDLIKERDELIDGVLVGRIAQEHVLQLGPGGTAKSFLAHSLADHITGSRYFESAFDETTDPSQVFGPPDIKAMVEDGKTRRVATNMLPEATDAFMDEFFNANGPLLHSIMPVLNERVFHNNGVPSQVPLRQAIMGTNKLNADADQAALWDRVHLRYVVGYIKDRANAAEMVAQAIARMAVVGRGVTTHVGQQRTTVTLEELDQAHKEALDLNISDEVFDTFFNIREELEHGKGIVVSDRRAVEGMAAVMANAWIRGHEDVQVADLDILAHMWWSLQDHISATRAVILETTNPGEKAALDLLDELDKLKAELRNAQQSGMDPVRVKRVGVESVRNAKKLLREADQHKAKASASGASTARLDELVSRTNEFVVAVGSDIFSLDPSQMAAING